MNRSATRTYHSQGAIRTAPAPPEARATAVATTPDLAAIAALDAALAAYGIEAVTVEEVSRWSSPIAQH